jgi:hypothetical protein
VFTPGHFLDMGGRDAVEKALARHASAGTIRKLSRGLYDYPVQHQVFGAVMPGDDAIAEALKGRDAMRLQPTGAYAANLLGLSEQVPMRVFFLTDALGRSVKIGRKEIILKHTTPRNMATAGRMSGLVIQALRHMGQRHVDERIVNILKSKLSGADKKQLLADVKYAPEWIGRVMRQIAGAQG